MDYNSYGAQHHLCVGAVSFKQNITKASFYLINVHVHLMAAQCLNPELGGQASQVKVQLSQVLVSLRSWSLSLWATEKKRDQSLPQ